jgi:Protein of unknown function (DUF4239)
MAWLGSFWFMGVALLLGVSLAVGGLMLVRKFVDHRDLEAHHDVATPFLSAIGTLYAVVLGFMVVDSLNSFDRARLTVEQEANALHDIFHLAGGLQPKDEQTVRVACTNYCKAVYEKEWDTMEVGHMSPEARGSMAALWDIITKVHPMAQNEIDDHNAMLTQITRVGDCRDQRRIMAEPSGDPIVWTVLLSGAVIMIVFTYFFGIENMRAQILMTILVTVVLSLNLILVASFGYPFSGDVKVSAEPFKFNIEHFKHLQAEREE